MECIMYEAERYKYDPTEKVSLLPRVPDGHCPGCNQYLEEVAWFINGEWKAVEDDGAYADMDDKLLKSLIGDTMNERPSNP